MIVHRTMFCWEDQTNLETRITTQIWYCFTTVMSKRNYVPLEGNWSGEKSPNCSFTDFFCQRMPGPETNRWKVETNLELEPRAATIVKIFSWCINSQLSITWHFWLIVNISWQEDSFRTFPFHSLRIIKQHLFSLFTFTFPSHSGSAYIATLVHLSLFLVGRMPWVSCEYFLWQHLFLYQHFWIVWLCARPWPCHHCV